MDFRYKAIQIKQTESGKMLTLFAAPSPEIMHWAGIPQKKRFGSGEETAGFQREENPTRIKSLCDFYLNDDNIIQNPLLCATRDIPLSSVRFEPSNDAEVADVLVGEVIISLTDFSSVPLMEIFGRVREYIENRVDDLKGKAPREDLIAALKIRAAKTGHFSNGSDGEEDLQEDQEVSLESDDNGDASAALFEESHILDFWQEIAARHELLKLIGEPVEEDEFLGFTRDALLSYLRPVVLVDGQHRLLGALQAARAKLNEESAQLEIEQRIAEGEAPEEVETDIIKRYARRLPISLLMSNDPAEQVFQFVVVNQKATPIGRALLGTIVSTTLSNDEMETVASRLKNAGIQVEESQAITYLARHPSSPFSNLVERGLTGDAKDLLQWNVFSSLISIFRDLQGGKLFSERPDYAASWRNKCLELSPIVSDYASNGFSSAFEYWKSLNGPWRSVFIEFWNSVRDRLGSTDNPDRWNYWGSPRRSNLFNKVSLTILTADFFKFMFVAKKEIENADAVRLLVGEWLEEVNVNYFDRDWELWKYGVKKDQSGIKNQWAALWTEHRQAGGQLPDKRLYRQGRSV